MGGVLLRICLLGRFRVERGDAVVPAEAWRRRPRDLVRLLALAPDRALHREEVIDQLWPDKDLERGANNLHRALHDLRKLLGPGAALLDKGVVRLSHDAWVDVEAFERGAASEEPAELAQAVNLYQGDLCPDEPYAEHLQLRRESLRQRFLDTALRLARHHGGQGREESAVAVLRHLLEIDPSHEEAHRNLMRLLAELGRPHDALRQFSTCVRALRQGLDASPAPETLALQRRISRGEIAAARRSTAGQRWRRIARRLLGTDDPPPLRGRTEVSRTLEELVRGVPQTLVLLGEAGVGKTRLAVEAARLAEARGATLLAGVAAELEGKAPYAPFVDAWADYARHEGEAPNPFEAFVSTPDAASEDNRLRLFQAVGRALEVLGSGGPVVVVVDDLHQADESSLQLFHFLARAARTQPLRLVATCREEEVGVGTPVHALVSSLHRERLARRALIDRLDRDAVAALAADLLGRSPDEELLLWVYRLASGNPFYTEEVVRAAMEGRPREPAPLPTDLAEVIRDRVTRLGPDTERLLGVAAVLGPRFIFEHAQILSELPPPGALEALEESLRARLVDEDGRGYRFRHAIVQEVLYGALPGARRRSLHRAAADLLEQEPLHVRADWVEALAHHRLAAGQPREALRWLAAAGRRAVARAGLEESVSFFERALEIAVQLDEADSAEQRQLLEDLGEARFRQGRYDGAQESWREGIGRCIAAGELDAAARLYARSARAAGWPGIATARSLALCEEGLAALEAAPEGPGIASLLHEAARAHYYAGSTQRGLALCRQALAVVRRLGVTAILVEALTTLGVILGELGELDEGLSSLREAATRAAEADLLYPRIRAHNNLGGVLEVQVGDLRAAREHYLAAATLAAARACASERLYCATNAARVHVWLGDLTSAERLLASLLPLGDRVPAESSGWLQHRLADGLLQWGRGDPTGAGELLRRCRADLGDEHEPSLAMMVINCLAELLLEQGERERAEQVLRDRHLANAPGAGASRVWSLCLLATLATSRGDLDAARAELDAAVSLAGAHATPWEREAILLATARLHAAVGKWEAAFEAFETTASLQGRAGKRWHRRRTLAAWAEALEARGEPGDVERAQELRAQAAAGPEGA